MYKNQLQELAQRSCFNLPSYSCIREGPDHAPRFKATVNFNGETFESPSFCSTLRLAEHAAAEVALNTLAQRGPSRALAARVLDETGVYKNLLQETAHRAGLNLPVYTTVRSGPGHVPVYSCTVELAGMSFAGEPARTKKQAQKNAAMAAWSALRKLSQHESSSSSSFLTPVDKGNEEQEQVIVARVLASLRPSESKASTENDRRDRHQRYTPICFRSTPPTPNLYPLRFQNWAYSNFPPELAMFQIYQQEQLLQQQYRLLALTVPPTIPSVPQIYPFMQSMFQPDHHIYFSNEHKSLLSEPKLSIASPNPSLCFSNNLVPSGAMSRSGVTIREIEEEKAEESSVFTPSRIPEPLILGNTSTEPRNQELVPESDKQKISESGSKIENARLQGNPIGQLEQTIHARRHSRSKAVDFPLPNPCRNDSSHPSIQPQYSQRGSSSLMIRTVGPSSSVGPRLQSITPVVNPSRMRTGAPQYRARHGRESFNLRGRLPTSIAPAVQIRSVVPVCSAPPARKAESSAQEGVSLNGKKENTESEDLSRTNDDFCKLRI